MLFLAAAAHATDLTVDRVPCTSLDKPIAEALCTRDTTQVLAVKAREHPAWFALEVDDQRPVDGGRTVTPIVWIDGAATRGMEGPQKILQLIAGLGPVQDQADAAARMRLYVTVLSDPDAWVQPEIPNDLAPCGERRQDEQCGVSAAGTGWQLVFLQTDNHSCECTVTWSKLLRTTVHLSPEGAFAVEETMLECAASPASETKSVCGKDWKRR